MKTNWKRIMLLILIGVFLFGIIQYIGYVSQAGSSHGVVYIEESLVMRAGPSIILPDGRSRRILRFAGEEVRLDIYKPSSTNAPIVLLVHGSAGIEGRERSARYKRFALDLVSDGFIAINIYYFDASRPQWIHTIVETINFAQGVVGADPNQIGLIGYSLGGTLAMRVAAKDSRLKALAIAAGYMPHGFSIKSVRNFPPTLMETGDKDPALLTLRTLKGWFQKLDKRFEPRINKGYGHSMPVNLFWENWEATRQFIRSHLQISPF